LFGFFNGFNLTTQVATATASSGTYGFNAGIELDIDTLEKQLNLGLLAVASARIFGDTAI
jgi:hypothetical protein